MKKSLLKKSLLALAATAVIMGPGWAEPLKPGPAPAVIAPITQSNVNYQLQVQDLVGVTHRLEEMAAQCQGRVTQSNSNAQGGNASVSLRIPEQALNAFCKDTASLGSIVSQNRSSSDVTNSYIEQRRNLELYEKMGSAGLVFPPNLTAAEKTVFEAEFKAYVRDRINSAKSTLSNYEQNRGWADVHINLQGPKTESVEYEHMPRPPIERIRSGEPPKCSVESKPGSDCGECQTAGSKFILVAGLGVLGIFWWSVRSRVNDRPGVRD